MTHRTNLCALRESAFLAQGHLCFYCLHPMWRADAKAFAAAHGISRDRARMFRLTAEHLAAKMDGGRTIASNIVAACRYCNHGRHALFPGSASDPEAYSFFVLLSVAAGVWGAKGPTVE
ncbi:HNH endonuclease family protein [Variovorax paradoxus B4]|nr:HNH endonuclease [Variovorax paradoxus]AGU49220.1 HNH endonuclease family protein [Variovorax paradoxus B4]